MVAPSSKSSIVEVTFFASMESSRATLRILKRSVVDDIISARFTVINLTVLRQA
jgi:hypothetical protein